MKSAKFAFSIGFLALAMTSVAFAQQKPYTDDLNENYKPPAVNRDYTRR